jgi:pyruvate/2-oxoglutarate dehydrogenase complex dihydrolipoamide acyltransferase (E2) component
MPSIPILMPQLGESIAEATIVRVLIETGAKVEAGQDIFEVETSKAVMTVTAPCSGAVGEVSAVPQTSYAVGATLGSLVVSEEDAKAMGFADQRSITGPVAQSKSESSNGSDTKNVHFAVDDHSTIHERQPTVEPVVGGLPVPAGAAGATYISARMRARMNEMGLNAADLSAVAGV